MYYIGNVNVAGYHSSLSPLSVVSTMVMWESSQWLRNNIVGNWLKVLQKSIDGCTGRRDISEILL